MEDLTTRPRPRLHTLEPFYKVIKFSNPAQPLVQPGTTPSTPTLLNTPPRPALSRPGWLLHLTAMYSLSRCARLELLRATTRPGVH